MPSPYVQDLFAAMAADPRLDLRVWYLEQEAPNTRWGEQEMPDYAEVLPGRWIGRENTRVHWNPGITRRLKHSDADLFVIVGYIGLTNQIAMRWLNRHQKPWVFWGEVPGLHQRRGVGSWIRQRLQSPLRQARGIAGVGSHAVAAYRRLVASGEMRDASFLAGDGSPSPRFARSSQGAGENEVAGGRKRFNGKGDNLVPVGGMVRVERLPGKLGDSMLFANLPYVCDLKGFQSALEEGRRGELNRGRSSYGGEEGSWSRQDSVDDSCEEDAGLNRGRSSYGGEEGSWSRQDSVDDSCEEDAGLNRGRSSYGGEGGSWSRQDSVDDSCEEDAGLNRGRSSYGGEGGSWSRQDSVDDSCEEDAGLNRGRSSYGGEEGSWSRQDSVDDSCEEDAGLNRGRSSYGGEGGSWSRQDSVDDSCEEDAGLNRGRSSYGGEEGSWSRQDSVDDSCEEDAGLNRGRSSYGGEGGSWSRQDSVDDSCEEDAGLNRGRSSYGGEGGSWSRQDSDLRNDTGHAPPRSIRFLYCGQLVERKGVDLLLEAFCDVAQHSPNCNLTFVGDGPLRNELQRQVPESLKDRVVFAGFQAVDQLPAFFAAADVFALPSRHDGWGVVVNQAVGAGLAVITTETVGAGNDLVDEGQNGFRIPANSADAIRTAITSFTEHPEQAARFGKRSQQIAATVSLGSAVDQWIRFFENSLATSN